MTFKYMEIMEFLKNEISKGSYKNKLPSIRGMAIKFSCSNSTVIKAYSELEDQGIIYSAPKSGYYISHANKEKDLEYDFYSGIPLSFYLPFDSIEKAYQSSFSDNNIGIINYSYTRGYIKLREHLANAFNIQVDRSRVFIVLGTQNFISLMIAMTTRLNQNILVENPTYNLLVSAVGAFGKKFDFVERNLDGLDLVTLEEKAKNGEFKYFYTMSRNHNPLGTSFDRKSRKKLLELAEKYDFYIIEDDYLYELSDEATLFSENPDRVIYVRSFSKTISPSLKLCSITVPEAIKEEFSKTNSFMNTGASLISQDVLYRYLTSTNYAKDTKILKERTEEKCRLLDAILKEKCPYRYSVPKCGMYSYIELPEGFRTMELLEILDNKGYRFRSDVEFSMSRDVRGLRISISRVEKKAIEKGINELIKEIKNLSNPSDEPKEIYL